MAGADGCSVPSHVFQPFHIISDWAEPITPTTRLTVSILLRSGVYPARFSVRVIDNCFNFGDESEFGRSRWLISNYNVTNVHFIRGLIGRSCPVLNLLDLNIF